jgi:tetratricopeptide (TPR) repeat protein
MVNSALLIALALLQIRQFEVRGEVVTQHRDRSEWVQIESIDRRFVDYTSIDFDGRFTFKKVPEGTYKVTVGITGAAEQQRSIEIRPAFADERGKVAVKVTIKDDAVVRDRFKVGIVSLAVSPKAIEELRRAHEAKGNVEKARKHLQKAIEISPNFDDALNNLGTYYFRDGRYDTAANLFLRALKANPNSFFAQVNLGGTFIALRDYERALAENLKALDMRPDDSLAQSQTGQTLFHLKQYPEALTHLRRAKQLDPFSFSLPGIFIAEILQIQGERERAIAEYKEFLSTHPGHPRSAFAEQQLLLLERRD